MRRMIYHHFFFCLRAIAADEHIAERRLCVLESRRRDIVQLRRSPAPRRRGSIAPQAAPSPPAARTAAFLQRHDGIDERLAGELPFEISDNLRVPFVGHRDHDELGVFDAS
jgi:hypothetical protein